MKGVATVAAAATIAGILTGMLRLLRRGALTIDLRVGRSVRPLGPHTIDVVAPREVVFDVISAPYLGRTSRALANKLRVIERGDAMVLAEHFTDVGDFVTTTLETVRFQRPTRVDFRLVRGPVPHVIEQFELHEAGASTQVRYSGELGTDLWALGRWWGGVVATKWEAAVRASLDGIKVEAERRASRRKNGI